MAGRVFAFADPEIIKLAKNDFIPVCADDWYQRRRKDDEGKFFLSVGAQSGRKGTGDFTRQGIYCLTADGEVLTYKNAGDLVKETREQLKTALRKFAALPDDRRKPGSVSIPAHGPLDPNFTRPLPEGGRVIRVHGRILDRMDGAFKKGSCSFSGGDQASRDFLWLTAADVHSLVPHIPTVGKTVPVPARVADRILRYHLVDNTRGEPTFWTLDEIRSNNLTLTVTSVGPKGIDMQMVGDAVMATSMDIEHAARGFEVRLIGKLHVDPNLKLDQFDVTALGEHWGTGEFVKEGGRPGRSLLGITFELVDPAVPANRVPPQGARSWVEYINADK